MAFLLFCAVLMPVAYPVHGAVMYGDPWGWIFKESTDDRRR